MNNDPIAEFKSKQRETWTMGNFGDMDVFTTPVAGHLVRYARVAGGQAVLDVGTGTGVVAITARNMGAKVTGLDLTPALLAQARESATVAGHDDIAWHEGDAEALLFPDACFDVVLSQFGHMFAPRPKVAVSEMLRVLNRRYHCLRHLARRAVDRPPVQPERQVCPVAAGRRVAGAVGRCRYRAATAGGQRETPALRAGHHGYPDAQPPAFAPVPGSQDGPFHPDCAGFAA